VGVFSEHGVDALISQRRFSARGRQITLRWQKQVFVHTVTHTALARLPGVI